MQMGKRKTLKGHFAWCRRQDNPQRSVLSTWERLCARVGVMLSINKSPRELSRTTRISRKDLFSHNYEALPFHLRYKRCRTGSLYSFLFFPFFFLPLPKGRWQHVAFHISTQVLQPFVITAECLQAEPPYVSILGLLLFVIVRQNIASKGAPTRRNCITAEIIPSAHQTLSPLKAACRP